MSGYCPEGLGTCRDANSGPCVVGHPCELYPRRQLALLLDSGVVVHDPSWIHLADVIHSFHGFGVNRVYGVIVDAETLEQVHPPVEQPPDHETVG